MAISAPINFYPRAVNCKDYEEFPGFIIYSQKMKDLMSKIRKMAAAESTTVLIQGESGTGKELVAQAINRLSSRHNKPFLAINCSTLTGDTLNSELFGHEKGSFTGATELRPGIFEAAQDGTVFLDEISELPEDSQAKLLRVLENKQIRRLGGRVDIRINVRIIAATNRKLDKLVMSGKFRPDLYYRLSVLEIEVPPLRERNEEVPVLSSFFLKNLGYHGFSFSAQAMERLQNYRWPGNIRELKNTIERTMLYSTLNEFKVVQQVNFLNTIEECAQDTSFEDMTLEQLELFHIENALRKTFGEQKTAAVNLGITPRVLNYKIKQFGIDCKKYKIPL